MAEQTQCPQVEQAVGWAMHALEPSDEQAFTGHLARCAECTAAVEEARDLMVALAAASEQGDPPARLRTSLMAVVRATPQDPQTPRASAPSPAASSIPASRRPGPRPGRPADRRVRSFGAGRWAAGAQRWRRAALAVAAVAAVVVGGGLVARQAPTSTEVQAESGEQTRELLAQVDQPGATHAVLSSPDGRPLAAVMRRAGRLDVVAAPDLPPNDPVTMYVLWGTAPSGPVALGSFAVGSGRAGPMPVGTSGSSAYPGYAVSVEPAGPLPSTPSRVVASGAVAS